jgi:hypothetical protein
VAHREGAAVRKKKSKTIARLGKTRARHAHRKQLIVGVGEPTATRLVRGSKTQAAMVAAMSTIAQRFEDFVGNIDQLNRALGQFKGEVMEPFREELKYLRYTTGDRLNHVSSDLERYVDKLDKVVIGTLRTAGFTEDQVKLFRAEQGLQPEAPRGFELEAHMLEVSELEKMVESLTRQNRRLIARATGHRFVNFQLEWVFDASCGCEVCAREKDALAQAEKEAQGGT